MRFDNIGYRNSCRWHEWCNCCTPMSSACMHCIIGSVASIQIVHSVSGGRLIYRRRATTDETGYLTSWRDTRPKIVVSHMNIKLGLDRQPLVPGPRSAVYGLGCRCHCKTQRQKCWVRSTEIRK